MKKLGLGPLSKIIPRVGHVMEILNFTRIIWDGFN